MKTNNGIGTQEPMSADEAIASRIEKDKMIEVNDSLAEQYASDQAYLESRDRMNAMAADTRTYEEKQAAFNKQEAAYNQQEASNSYNTPAEPNYHFDHI